MISGSLLSFFVIVEKFELENHMFYFFFLLFLFFPFFKNHLLSTLWNIIGDKFTNMPPFVL